MRIVVKKIIIFLSVVFLLSSKNVFSETLVPSESDKKALEIHLLIHHNNPKTVFTKDIDNKLTIIKDSEQVQKGEIVSNVCLLTNFEPGYYDMIDKGIHYLERDINLFLVKSVYEQYGIKNLSRIIADDSSLKIENFAKSKGIDIKVKSNCKNYTASDKSYLYEYESDVFFIPQYLAELLHGLKFEPITKVSSQSFILTYTFDEIKSLSDNYQKVVLEKDKSKNELLDKYKSLAESKSKEYIGSIWFSVDQYDKKNQKFCTLNYTGEDAVAVIGYRLKGDDIIYNDWLDDNQYSLKYGNNQQYYANTYENINDAYIDLKEKILKDDYYEHCNFFVDYPENLLKLANALERDTEWALDTYVGNLYNINETGNEYAILKGFDNYDQYNFSYDIDANKNQIDQLKEFGIIDAVEFKKVQDEIIQIKYSNETNISNVITYLNDLIEADQKGMNVLDYKKARIEEEKRVAKVLQEQAEKAQQEFAKEYPYTAILSCGMGDSHINIAACFVEEKYSVPTELKINNGGNNRLYKPWNLREAGRETNRGLEIDLKRSFSINAQNSSSNLTLGITIIENSSGEVTYSDSVGKFGVINVGN